MHLRTEEMDHVIEQSLVTVLGSEGYSVYLRQPGASETVPLVRGVSMAEAHRWCKVMRRYVAGVILALHASEL